MWRVNSAFDDIPIAKFDTAWSGDEAKARLFTRAKFDDDTPNLDRAREGFLFYDDERSTVKAGYKMPICDVMHGELFIVPHAVSAAAAALNGARGGVDVPDDVAEEAKGVLNRIYERMERPSPFEKALKFVDSHRLRGYGVIFGGKDLEGETFTGETDFWFTKLALKHYPVLYDHGHHEWLRDAVIGKAEVHRDEVGIWLDIELSRAQEYQEYVALVTGLAQKGALGLSSGAVAHLVRRDGTIITQWPIVEFSLTPTPAEPRTVGVSLVKSVNTAMFNIINTESEESMLYATNNETTKTFKDFIYAVARNDDESLKAMGAIKDITTTSAGVLVPPQFVAELMRFEETSLGELLKRTMQIRNPRSNIINVPALYQTGRRGMYGGIVANIVGEGELKPEVDPVFAQIQVRLYKLAGITQVSDELLTDSQIPLDQLLAQLFRGAMLSEAERLLLLGTGVGEPLGILGPGNTALVTIPRDAGGISVANIAEMYAAQLNPANAVWIASPSVLPALVTLSAGNVIAWARDLSSPIPALILGRPLIISRHAPFFDRDGALSFVDLSHVVTAYTDPVVQSSQDYAFAYDLTTWRFVMRFGAQPNVNTIIDTGTEVRSAFVQISAQ